MIANRCALQTVTYAGFEALALSNGIISLTTIPSLGGKIVSIQHLASQREWLWQNPHLPLQAVVYDASYVTQYDSGGFDECFPAVSAGPYPTNPWAGVSIPDHGELWCQPWSTEIVHASGSQVTIKQWCHGVRFPYRFERTLGLTNDSPHVTFNYQITNFTGFDFPFVWSSHPILNIEPGMSLALPEQVKAMRIDFGTHDQIGSMEEWIDWPTGALASLPAADFGQAYKLYSPPLTGDEPVDVAIRDAHGEHTLAFRFFPHEITHIGVWLNLGGWSGCGSIPYYNLGLEPCIGGADALATAQARDQYALARANQQTTWQLQLSIL